MAERVLFGTDEMQPGVGGRNLPPQLPGAQEVEPGAEAGFSYGELRSLQIRPALWQVVVLQKNKAGFVDAGQLGEINIAKPSGNRLAVLPQKVAGVAVVYFSIHGEHYSGHLLLQ